jgi:hypothetical protein
MIQVSFASIFKALILIGIAGCSFPGLSPHILYSSSPEVANFAIQPYNYTPTDGNSSDYFRFSLSPGKTIDGQVIVMNTGKKEGVALIKTVDGITSSSSGIAYAADDTIPQDVGAWITFSPSQVTLKANGSQVIDFKITVPETTWIGQHVGGIVAENGELMDGSSSKNVKIKVLQRSVAPIIISNPGASLEKLELNGAEFLGLHEMQRLSLNLTNSGEVFVEPKGEINVKDSSGKILKTLPFTMDKVVPHTTFSYDVIMKGEALTPGKYTADITLTYGKDAQRLDLTKEFSITEESFVKTFGPTAEQYLVQNRTPWWVYVAGVIAVLLIVGIIVQVVLLRRRKRSRAVISTSFSKVAPVQPDTNLIAGDVLSPEEDAQERQQKKSTTPFLN